MPPTTSTPGSDSPHNAPVEVFSIEGETYAVTASLRAKLVEKTRTEDTESIYVDSSGVIHHTYTSTGGETVTERTDVLETFQTYPEDARDTLSSLGCRPLEGLSTEAITKSDSEVPGRKLSEFC